MFSSNSRSAATPPYRKVAAADSTMYAAGGLVSTSGIFRSCARSFSQMAPPMPTIASNCASRVKKKNFQNRRPTPSLLDELIAQPVHGLDAGAPVGQRAELV